jgi:RNA polymerase sigma-70 factor (ECF subfamily)
MTATRSSLLRRIHDHQDSESWNEFDGVYRPLLTQYARQRGMSAQVAEEIAQDCLIAVAKQISGFERRRSFRAWLRAIVDHKVADHLAKQRGRKKTVGDAALSALRDYAPQPGDAWEQQWNEAVATMLAKRLQTSFAAHTVQAFTLYVLDGKPVEEISTALGMTANQIYVAKSRVARYLRENCADLIDALYGVWQ